MEIKLVREVFTKKSTIGKLSLDGKFECFVLEDTCREATPGTWKPELKVPKVTAIPYGRYEVLITFSDRFQRLLPLLAGVPDYEGIRIHPGNSDVDTDGCLLPGQRAGDDVVYDSRAAFSLLFIQLQTASAKGKIFITITKDPATISA